MKKAYRAAAALPILACALAVGAAPATAQSGMDDLVRMQLDSAVSYINGQGFALEREYQSGWLQDGDSEEVSLPLLGGRTYMIVGVCDADCSDLDLALATQAGVAVDSDYATDDIPMIMAETTQSGGMYVLTVSMPACSIEPCGYGLAVFARED